jgi:PII-like signaling protein
MTTKTGREAESERFDLSKRIPSVIYCVDTIVADLGYKKDSILESFLVCLMEVEINET